MTREQLFVPLAIVLAGGIIAVAVYFINKSPGSTATPMSNPKVRAYDPSTDYIFGNPNAQVVLIEYADFECPHCKTYSATIHQLIDEYGPTGQVAWVYRHFPIAQLHSKAPKEAEAAECAADVGGGGEAYYKFIARLFEVTPSNNGLDLNTLPDIAETVGIDKAAFKSCLDSGKFTKKIEAAVKEATDLGIRGTPHTFISVAGNFLPVEGAQSLSAMRTAVGEILKELNRPAASSTPAQ